jgi:hypothetical protein
MPFQIVFTPTWGNDRYDGGDDADLYIYPTNEDSVQGTLEVAFGDRAELLASSLGVSLPDATYGIAVKTAPSAADVEFLPRKQYDLLVSVEAFQGGRATTRSAATKATTSLRFLAARIGLMGAGALTTSKQQLTTW